MNIIVIGLGNMGCSLANRLSRQGHGVVAVDKDPECFEELSERFAGETIEGNGLDRTVLGRARIERADAIVACTASDETNMVIARVARDTYRVPRVIARLYDTTKAETYRRLGIQTISTTDWGVRRVCELLTYRSLDAVFDIGSGDVHIMRADVPHLLEGHAVQEITVVGEISIIAISHDNDTFVPTLGTVLGHGDIIYAAVSSNSTGKFAYMLGKDR